ncbi:MAG TPA: diguanylate cyclase [Accumulibacter sp.]|nr:diguanylate cyclase [Accumulibacter sp.]
MLKATRRHLEDWANPRTVVVLTVLLITALWIIVFVSASTSRQQHLDLAGDALQRSIHAVETQTRQQLQLVETLLGACEHWLSENPDRDPGHDPGFKRLVDSLRAKTGGSVHLRLLGVDGTLIDSLEQKTTLASATERQLLQKISQTSGLTIATPFSFAHSGLPGLPVAIRLTNDTHRLIGLLAVLDLPSLSSTYERQRSKPLGQIMLLKRDGTVLMHAPEQASLYGKRLELDHLLENPAGKAGHGVIVLEQALIDTGDERGSELAAYALLAKYPLLIVVSQASDEALAPWLRQTLWIMLLALVMTVPMTVVAYRSLRLIHTLAAQHAHLTHLTTSDRLTGVSSRQHFVEQLAERLEDLRPDEPVLTLLLFDIDFFKRLNDGYGHTVGDQVLISFAKAAKSCLRDHDLLGRVGAGEFAILLPQTPVAKALLAAERIRRNVAEIAIESADGMVRFTSSVGIAEATTDDVSTEDLLKRAGRALQQAKAKGHDRVEVFNPA